MNEQIREAAEYVRDNAGYYDGCINDPRVTVDHDFRHAAKKIANYLLELHPRECQVKYLPGEGAETV
jgi:hypothetical protein